MGRGFMDMRGASVLGCANHWKGPSTTSQVMTSFPAFSQEPQETEEIQLGRTLGCSLCEAKKKAIADARRARGVMGGRYQLMNGTQRPALGQICATKPVSSDGMNCQKTSAGDVICSNGVLYSGECPNSPSVNYPGVAVNVGKGLAPTPPPAPGAAPAPNTVQPPTAVTPDGLPADTGVSPIAIGAGVLVGAGLLVLLLK